jgi:hypothetical protein
LLVKAYSDLESTNPPPKVGTTSRILTILIGRLKQKSASSHNNLGRFG